MTITTRTIAKRIPPRLHDPKPKGKPHAKKGNTKTTSTQGSRKRVTRDSDDGSGPEENEVSSSSSDDSESARRAKKKAGKRRRVEVSDSEVEVVEDDERPGKDIEEVDDGVGDEQEVSPYHLLQASLTHHTLERWSQ